MGHAGESTPGFKGSSLGVPARTDLFSKQAGGCLLVSCGLQTIKPCGARGPDHVVDFGAGAGAGQSLAKKGISAPAASHKP